MGGRRGEGCLLGFEIREGNLLIGGGVFKYSRSLLCQWLSADTIHVYFVAALLEFSRSPAQDGISLEVWIQELRTEDWTGECSELWLGRAAGQK